MEKYQSTEKLNRKYKLIIFDWDGTAVEDRNSDTTELSRVINTLLQKNVIIAVVTGTNFNNIERQFGKNIKGPQKHNLLILSNRGSEAYGFSANIFPDLLYRRNAAPEENLLLDTVSRSTKEKIEKSLKVNIDIISNRLNRRKIDLYPEWDNPKKSEFQILLDKTEERLISNGFSEGIKGAYEILKQQVKAYEFKDAHITSDIKHLEIGLTDKSDSINWIFEHVVKEKQISDSEILIVGDEFGNIAGFSGSDYKMFMPNHPDICYLSVGIEPNGVPEGILHLKGGPYAFLKILEHQCELYN